MAERAQLEAEAAARGFEAVCPETLSVPDQIALFRAAIACAGEYGSGLYGTLFSEPGAAVLSIRNGDPALGFLQSGLDHAVGHDSGYVIGTLPVAEGVFSAAPEAIAAGLDWLALPRRA